MHAADIGPVRAFENARPRWGTVTLGSGVWAQTRPPGARCRAMRHRSGKEMTTDYVQEKW